MIAMLMASGPGIVVAGSVMGSGELINTPIQAAKFGFVLLWAVIVSCLIKYFLQVEIARHCLVHNRTTVEALNLCPGPKWRNTSWVGLVYMLGYTVTLIGVVGMIGAIAGLMHAVAPLMTDEAWSQGIWAVLLVLVTQILLWRSHYGQLEKLITVLVGGFSLSVVVSLVLLQNSPHRVGAADIFSGLTFSLGDQPKLAAYAVISLIGALGTTANELFMYPYWVMEKGYAGHLGPREAQGWLHRAKGWVRVLQVDAGLATLLATVVTAAYFLLGAAIFHRQGRTPQGMAVVWDMSAIFTQTFGGWSTGVFLIGAFCTLFSTVLVAIAATGRMWTDVLCSMGFVNRHNPQSVQRSRRAVQSLYLAGGLILFLVLHTAPARLVIFGQFFAGIFNTPLLIFGICWMAFRTDRQVRMRNVTAVALLGSVVVILGCVGVGLAIQSGLIS